MMSDPELPFPWGVQSSPQQSELEAWRARQSALGEQLLGKGDSGAAAGVFQQILDTLPDSPSFERCDALDWLGRCFQDGGQPDEAERLFRAALAMVDVLEQTDIANRRAVRMGQPDRAKHQKALVQVDLGNVLIRLRRYPEAEALCNSALALTKDLGNTSAESVIHSQLGELALEQRHLKEATRHYQEARSLSHRLGDRSGEGVAWHQLGRVRQAAGELDEAEQCYRRSAQLAESQGDAVRLAGTWDQLAQVCALSGKPEAAEAWYRKALETRRRSGDVAGLSITLGNLADFLLYKPGALAEARQLAKEALRIRQSFSPGASRIWEVYTLLAKIADKENDDGVRRSYRREARAALRNSAAGRRELLRYGSLIATTIVTVNLPHLRAETEPQLAAMEKEGWAELVNASRRILDGERDVEVLCEPLGLVEAMVVETILEGIRDPATLNDLRNDDYA